MSTLRPPSLGPIVGHTTHDSCRIWIRGADAGDPEPTLSEDVRTLGVVAVTHEAGVRLNPAPSFYFRLHREYDRTGSFELGVHSSFKTGRRRTAFRLQPDTEYRVRSGSLSLDDARGNDATVTSPELENLLPSPEAWVRELEALPEACSKATFRTFPDPANSGRLAFLFGSCRYPGLYWKRKHADRIFAPMLERVVQGPAAQRPRFVLMVGDQIYADMFNRAVPIGLADTYEEFQERYLTAFGSTNMRNLMRSAPHYMILDDHEIEDNWTQDRIQDRKKRLLFNVAIGAYCNYQWSHAPRHRDRRLYYEFRADAYPFFVVDGRTQRYKEEDPTSLDDNHLLGRPARRGDDPTQLDRLCSWLRREQRQRGNIPKFIVTASVFVPNSVRSVKSDRHKNESDSWPAFPKTREALLQTIVRHQIQNVIFLSGDIHCSNVARIRFSGTPQAAQLRAYSVTSSAFYWPFFFADGEPSDYVHDSQSEGDSFAVTPQVQMDYEAWNFTQEDNFGEIVVNPGSSTLVVRFFGRKGELIRKGRRQLEERLQLDAW